jgi:hypothetical protein
MKRTSIVQLEFGHILVLTQHFALGSMVWRFRLIDFHEAVVFVLLNAGELLFIPSCAAIRTRAVVSSA